MNFTEARDMVLGELQSVFQNVKEEEVELFVDILCSAEKVFVTGVGRVLIMMQAFEKRLNHLGIDTYYVGEINEPAITENDVLVVGSGSGESIVPLTIVKKAAQFSPKIVHIGSNPQSSMTPYETLFVRIPCLTKLELEGEVRSGQMMTTLFDQSLLLLCDMVSLRIADKKNITDLHVLWKKHANLE